MVDTILGNMHCLALVAPTPWTSKITHPQHARVIIRTFISTKILSFTLCDFITTLFHNGNNSPCVRPALVCPYKYCTCHVRAILHYMSDTSLLGFFLFKFRLDSRMKTMQSKFAIKDLGHVWLGYIRMLGHLQMSAHMENMTQQCTLRM